MSSAVKVSGKNGSRPERFEWAAASAAVGVTGGAISARREHPRSLMDQLDAVAEHLVHLPEDFGSLGPCRVWTRSSVVARHCGD